MERSEAAGLHDVGALEALRVPTRRRLYEHVVQCGRPVSRDECSQAVRVDRSLVAYHLDKLVEHGLLEVTYSRPHGRTGPGAGRPAKLYRRTAREFVLRAPARDYRLLAEVLVRAADAAGPAVRAGTERAALELGRDLAAGVEPGRGDEALTELLRSRGYE